MSWESFSLSKNVSRNFFVIKKCVEKVFHLQKCCRESFLPSKISWESFSPSKNGRESFSPSQNVSRIPFHLHKVVLEVVEMDAEVGERVVDTEVFCWMIHVAPCWFRNQVKLILHHIPDRLHTKSYSDTFDLSDIYSQLFYTWAVGCLPISNCCGKKWE